MKNNHLPLSQSHFINGNEACAEAALLAGCRFFAGYPITPSTEIACVVVDVQRGGPSTGLATLVGQGDMMQARWGSHGSYEIIALCPSSPQEFFYQTIPSFNLSEKFRVPVLLMADEMVGHMSEKE